MLHGDTWPRCYIFLIGRGWLQIHPRWLALYQPGLFLYCLLLFLNGQPHLFF